MNESTLAGAERGPDGPPTTSPTPACASTGGDGPIRASLPAPLPRGTRLSWFGLACLLVVYVVWGSTYLAIRIAVREGSGFPPFTMGGSRVLLAGVALLLLLAAARQSLRISRRDAEVLALSGVLMWVGGNGLVTWAEQRIPSGYAALLVSTTPIWVAIVQAALDRQAPTPLMIAALLTGLGGVALLTAPTMAAGLSADTLGVLAVLAAAVCWGMGSLVQSRHPVRASGLANAGYQQVFGGLAFGLVAIGLREPVPTPSAEAWWAWGYLAIFGSMLAYTAFVQALRLLPTTIVMTYAYVNPGIAVLLGWLVLGEPLGWLTLAGMALVLLGIAGVFWDRARRGS